MLVVRAAAVGVAVTAPISAYVGYNGSGKTLGAVLFEALPALRRGVPVVSSVALDHPLYVPLRSWREIWALSGCVLILDDVSAQFPARGAMTVPPQLVVKMNILRHDNVQVIWTAPSWRRADVTLREVTQEVTECVGWMPDTWERMPEVAGRGLNPRVLRRDGKRVRANPMWRPNRLFRFTTYDATRFTEYTEEKVKKIRPKRRAWYYRPWHDEQFLYDTLAPVSLLDHVDEGGWCLLCGGKRSSRACRCDGSRGSGTGRRREPSEVPDLAASGVLT